MTNDKKVDKNPTAINILKLQRYNFNFLSLEEVVFYEYLIVKARSFKFKQFYHSTETISKETGIRRTKLDNIIKKFSDLGILMVEIKGFPKVKYFDVNFEKIGGLLPKIYQFAETNKLDAGFSKLCVDFYKPLVETYIQKNNNSIYNKNTKEEKVGPDHDWDTFLVFFKNKLIELKNEKQLTPAQLKYKEEDLFAAFSHYDQDTIMQALAQFFKPPAWNKKLMDFLKREELNRQKIAFIEQHVTDNKKYVENFIKELSAMYNHRRSKNNTAKKEYPATTLPVNQSILNQVAEVLSSRSEQEIKDSFIVYCDQVISGDIKPRKFLPYFLSKNDSGEFSVVDDLLNYYNLNYVTTIK